MTFGLGVIVGIFIGALLIVLVIAIDAGKPAPRCADGRRVHNFAGQPSCPSCGWRGIHAR